MSPDLAWNKSVFILMQYLIKIKMICKRLKLYINITKKYNKLLNSLIKIKKFNKKDSTYTSIKANKKITIRHLLPHSSGLGYGFIDSNPEMKAIFAKKNK